MNNKKILPILAAVALLQAGCGAKPSLQEGIKVELAPVLAMDGSAAAYYSGTIEAQRSIPLSFLALGTVSEVNVREGQQVLKGEVLAKLDCQSNENALKMAEAKSKQAEDAFRRFEPMYKNGNLPEIKFVEIETGRDEAALSLKMAAKNAADCSIVAPESGLISERAVEPGSSAMPGRAALKLVTVDQVYAAISVPEGEISKIKPGVRAEVEIAALREDRYSATGDSRAGTLPVSPKWISAGNGRFRGVVTDSGVSANPFARTYNVRVLLNNPGRRILPGMICGVYISGSSRSKLALVPSTAVSLDESGQQYVYVAEPGAASVRKRIIKTSGFANGGILVSSGLAAGEQVVSAGVQKLSDGALISMGQL